MAVIPTMISLFGPVDGSAALTQTPTTTWAWPGSCITSHTFPFFFNSLASNPLPWGVWRVCWSWKPGWFKNGPIVLRLVSCDDGPTNIVEMARISTANWPAGINVWNAPVGITAAMNTLIAAKVYKNVGWQWIGDGSSQATILVSRLELYWQT